MTVPTPFSLNHLIGHAKIKRYLERILARHAVPHSLLFSGPEGVGKRLFAEAFGRQILGTEKERHPDLHLYRPEGKTGMHSLDTLRAFGREVSLAPFEAKKKIFILDEADRMLPTSANALLKTFEEPPKDSIIILISSRPEKLLPTILSRCQKVSFQPFSREEVATFLCEQHSVPREEAERVSFQAKGSLGKGLQKVHKKEQEGEEGTLEATLLKGLAEGALKRYGSLLELAERLAASLEKRLKEEEEALREAFFGDQADHLSALQKEALNKEVEGVLSLQKVGEVKVLFEAVLGWFRDLHLLQVRGDPSFLMHPAYEAFYVGELEAVDEKGGSGESAMISLEIVQKAAASALLSLERSTSLKICFEQLFMRLGRE